jgi:hypothetical protein
VLETDDIRESIRREIARLRAAPAEDIVSEDERGLAHRTDESTHEPTATVDEPVEQGSRNTRRSVRQAAAAESRATEQATPPATTEESGDEPGGRRRGWMQLLVAAALIAAVITGLPHLPQLVDWGRGLVPQDAPTRVGDAVPIAGSLYHPPMDVTVGAPVPVRLRSGAGAKAGDRLIAVRLELRNNGEEAWTFPSGRVVVVDSIGFSHTADTVKRSIAAGRLLPAAVRVRPSKAVTGFLAFSLPKDTGVKEVRITLAGSEEAVVWSARP